MAGTVDTSICLAGYYFPEDIKIKVIHRYFFIEACHVEGVKGVNYTKHKFKTCRKLPQNIDVSNLKAFYSKSFIRITFSQQNVDEIELVIDKTAAKIRQKPKPVEHENGNNFNNFMKALKDIHMIWLFRK